jgi:hypothetical protein
MDKDPGIYVRHIPDAITNIVVGDRASEPNEKNQREKEQYCAGRGVHGQRSWRRRVLARSNVPPSATAG